MKCYLVDMSVPVLVVHGFRVLRRHLREESGTRQVQFELVQVECIGNCRLNTILDLAKATLILYSTYNVYITFFKWSNLRIMIKIRLSEYLF